MRGGVGAATNVTVVRNKHEHEKNHPRKVAEPKKKDVMDYSRMSFSKRQFILNSEGEVTTYENKLPFQAQVKDFYDSKPIQIFVAFLILSNFVVSACYKYYDPAGDRDDMYKIFNPFEWFYGYVFLVELLVNMYGSFFVYFWWGDMYAWNWFDFVIVVVSLMALYLEDLPGISVLRLFRAFRVVRLFKRVPEMRKMIESILQALPAMGYAFAALILLMGIWAIIGVEFLYDWPNEDSKVYGSVPEGYYFGDFWKAMLTLFQIMTFDSWASGIARDICYDKAFFVVYFISYVFLCSIIMQNVLIAALLDVYLSGDSEEEEEFAADDPVEKRFDDPKSFGAPQVTISEEVEMTRKSVDPKKVSAYDELSKLSTQELLSKVLNRMDDIEGVMNEVASKYVTNM